MHTTEVQSTAGKDLTPRQTALAVAIARYIEKGAQIDIAVKADISKLLESTANTARPIWQRWQSAESRVKKVLPANIYQTLAESKHTYPNVEELKRDLRTIGEALDREQNQYGHLILQTHMTNNDPLAALTALQKLDAHILALKTFAEEPQSAAVPTGGAPVAAAPAESLLPDDKNTSVRASGSSTASFNSAFSSIPEPDQEQGDGPTPVEEESTVGALWKTCRSYIAAMTNASFFMDDVKKKPEETSPTPERKQPINKNGASLVSDIKNNPTLNTITLLIAAKPDESLTTYLTRARYDVNRAYKDQMVEALRNTGHKVVSRRKGKQRILQEIKYRLIQIRSFLFINIANVTRTPPSRDLLLPKTHIDAIQAIEKAVDTESRKQAYAQANKVLRYAQQRLNLEVKEQTQESPNFFDSLANLDNPHETSTAAKTAEQTPMQSESTQPIKSPPVRTFIENRMLEWSGIGKNLVTLRSLYKAAYPDGTENSSTPLNKEFLQMLETLSQSDNITGLEDDTRLAVTTKIEEENVMAVIRWPTEYELMDRINTSIVEPEKQEDKHFDQQEIDNALKNSVVELMATKNPEAIQKSEGGYKLSSPPFPQQESSPQSVAEAYEILDKYLKAYEKTYKEEPLPSFEQHVAQKASLTMVEMGLQHKRTELVDGLIQSFGETFKYHAEDIGNDPNRQAVKNALEDMHTIMSPGSLDTDRTAAIERQQQRGDHFAKHGISLELINLLSLGGYQKVDDEGNPCDKFEPTITCLKHVRPSINSKTDPAYKEIIGDILLTLKALTGKLARDDGIAQYKKINDKATCKDPLDRSPLLPSAPFYASIAVFRGEKRVRADLRNKMGIGLAIGAGQLVTGASSTKENAPPAESPQPRPQVLNDAAELPSTKTDRSAGDVTPSSKL